MSRRGLLVCGILASVLYVATDALGALWWRGYSYINQTISELSAIGAPSRPIVMPFFLAYAVLVIVFGAGLWRSAQSRAMRMAGVLTIAYGAFCLGGPFGPMHQREVLAAGGKTLTDTIHLVGAAIDVLFILSVIAFAAAALDRRFRVYSIATVFVMLAFGAWAARFATAVEANQPTPWLGLIERACVFSGMAWFAVLAVALLRSEKGGNAMITTNVKGHVTPDFDAVRDTFADNFTRRGELGGACCAYRHGEKVVDLWGGIRNKDTGEPWDEDTMVIIYSATKGLAAMTLAIAHSRRWLDYDEKVCAYWPEFAQQGKDNVTVRQLLAHQAGLFAFDEQNDRSLLADPDRLAVVLARQKPAWEPGTRQAYHAITLGLYESELLRRIDPLHRTVGQFFQDEIATPLGLEVYIRLPESIPNSRLAKMAPLTWRERLFGFPPKFMLEVMKPHANIVRALAGSMFPHDEARIYARNFEVPSGGAVGTARAIARAYSAFATGGRELGLRKETLELLAAPAIPPKNGFYDECMKAHGVQFSLGFMKPSPVWPFGSQSAFGAPGTGGSLGFADPEHGVGYAYVTSKAGTALTGDPREVALRNAVYDVIAHGETRRDRPSRAA